MKKLLTTLLVAAACVTTAGAANPYDNPDTIYVSRDGTGQFRTISEAVEVCRAFMSYHKVIYVKNGVYKEKLIIPSWLTNIEICGQSAFKNITIENNAARLGQAVALHTEGDRLVFTDCRLLGNQDTVYTGMGGTRLYFDNCYIEGTTDFIFGPSTAWFENCEIHSKQNSYITAASTPEGTRYGYVFNRCHLTAAAGVDKVYLGRPWRPWAHTLFMNCEMGAHIVPAGWHNWGDTANEKTARYEEYNNSGAGASTAQRVGWSRQLTKKEAAQVTTDNVFTINDKWTVK